jgi:hypothetical protein
MINQLDFLNSGSPPAQDFILLDGQKSPGRASITGAGSPRKWDEKGGFGYSGASLVYLGNGLSDFDVVIDLWEPSHWKEWTDFARLLEKVPDGVLAKAHTIVHPLLNRAPLKITKVVIRDVTQFEQNDKGLWTARIPMKSFKLPQQALGKPDGTITKANLGISDFSDDPEIAARLKKQAAMGGVL